MAAERLARNDYDYLCIDQQHGLLGIEGVIRNLQAIDAGGSLGLWPTVGLVRIGVNDFRTIGQVLDAGAAGIIVPMVESSEAARQTVSAAKYPPLGRRSYGQVRGELRRSEATTVVNDTTFVAVMIETREGYNRVEEIAAVDGIDALYVGPWDLTISLTDGDLEGSEAEALREEALAKVVRVAHEAGKAAGTHADSGDTASQRLAQGYDFVSVEGDLTHLEEIAQNHLARARS